MKHSGASAVRAVANPRGNTPPTNQPSWGNTTKKPDGVAPAPAGGPVKSAEIPNRANTPVAPPEDSVGGEE